MLNNLSSKFPNLSSQVLNCSAWQNISDDYDVNSKMLLSQFEAIKILFKRYKAMEVFENIAFDSRLVFIDVAPNVNCYFSLIKSNPLELRSKLLMTGKNKSRQKGISLFIELCLCAPFKMATLERFFSNMYIIKILN